MVLAWSMGSLKNQILISMPHMNDPFFSKSVVYICEHGNGGAMGMIINKNLDAPELREIFDKFFKIVCGDRQISRKRPNLAVRAHGSCYL